MPWPLTDVVQNSPHATNLATTSGGQRTGGRILEGSGPLCVM